ncbi:MAG: sigma-54-dependent Fis family transcriptional regulator [Acidobacteria bacterium]|nr:sigma-54-dependent Fis family transcriptional regulator [Acidobacteriota bacterium]
MSKQKQILFVEDEQSLRQIFQYRLHEAGYAVLLAEDGVRGYEVLAQSQPDLVITDLAMPEMNGLELLRRVKAISPDTPVIVLTAHGEVQTAVAAMRLGAADYLTKPLEWDELLIVIDRALRLKDLTRENRELRAFIEERFQLNNIIGTSKRMRELYDVIERVARTDISVLLLGESGTGKELVAKGIHHHGKRSNRAFVTIDCGAIPEPLLEAELFGHRKGAFTGATYDKRGLFEEAAGGTVFLDEIGELPLNLQVKLLRVLQNGDFLRLGETTPRHVDVRIIAATNRDLAKMVEDGTFREDLYFRLNIVPIKLPPLRARREDIPLLVSSFLDDAGKKYERPGLQIAKEVYLYFHQYPWPGNVRELKNLIERLVVLTSTEVITAEDLPEEIKRIRNAAGSLSFNLPEDGIDLEEVEKEIIKQALDKNNWHQTRTAQYLNITRNTLIYRMQKYSLSEPHKS